MDKVQKIREEVERLKSLIGNNSFLSDYEKGFNDGREDICDNLISFIDSLQEEPKFKTGDRIKPVDSCLGSPRTIVDICNSWYVTDQGTLDFEFEDNWELVEEPVSEELEEASKNYALNNTPWDDCKDEIQESFKAGAKWQKIKDESATEDLGEYINKLSKQFPEVSFAKLSRIAVRVAKWQKEQFEKDYTNLCNGIATAKGVAVAMAYDKGMADARKAVEIAREEMIEKVCEFLDNELCCYIKAQDFAIEHQRLENDLRQAIKDE